MKLIRLTLPTALALVAVLCTAAMGQDDDRRERRGNRGGFGGPGPGGPGGGMFGGADPLMGLLMSEKVRGEINLLPDQEEALKKLREQTAGSNERPDFDFGSASESERRAFFEKMQQQRRESEKQTREKLEEVLGPDQLARLEEISLQVRGTGALGDPEVAAALNVTPEQKAKFESIRAEMEAAMRDRMRELFQSNDRDKMREEFQKARKEMDEKMLAVLNDEQRQQFEEMKGEAFELPEGHGGRGGFRGPGGGGRPGGFGRGSEGRGEAGDRSGRRPDAE